MKNLRAVAGMACLFQLFSSLPVLADEADDIQWVAQCMADNKDEGQPAAVVRKYCECMVSKMDDNETQSVTQWEKSHPQERKECAKVSGWK